MASETPSRPPSEVHKPDAGDTCHRGPVACTIISNNYLAFARTFADSFQQSQAGAEVFVLFVDRPDPSIDYEDQPFEALFADEIGIPAFQNFAFRYSILELNTAVKPFFLAHLRRTLGCDRLCYFDPDILITGDLGPLYKLLGTANLVLTPHILDPLTDQAKPGETDFLLSGSYNLGFLGLACNEETDRFLGWWQEKLYTHCLHEVEKGLFVDQRWMDLAPSLVDKVTILRDPGYNVAYWNLPHRQLRRAGNGWAVESLSQDAESVPLRFYHFSGFNLRKPEKVSKYQDRYTLEDRPDLHEIFERYQERLGHHGHEVWSALPYRLGTFSNGIRIPATARHVLRTLDPKGKRWQDPFRAEAQGSFYRWLQEPAAPDSEIALPRLALELWRRREDLQQAFVEPTGRDLRGFASWYVESGAREAGICEAFIQPTLLTLSQATDGVPPQEVPSSLTIFSRSGELAPVTEEAVGFLTAEAGGDAAQPSTPLMPRFALLIHQHRSDLQTSFPEPLGRSRAAFVRWCATYGRMEYSLPESLVQPMLRSLPWSQRISASLWWYRHRRSPQRAPAVT